ncbi:SDR family oxidoreductase [Ferviditalea candida]|uniref:SDR family oxidoreductase n=1 Tax=Ferviditalea candida TaxID=3108399 RepID=A0ABU5ZNL4_9BACL|nr:SDR family oxidoreductase [Paenibacillaceae bacterium T2]
MRLKNKVCIITGAGSGIGQATAKLFAKEGAAVIIADIDHDGGQETVDLLTRAGGQCEFISCNVTDSKQVRSMAERVVAHYGRIDVLFNNAGISGIGTVHETEPEDWDAVMNVNVKGVFLSSKYVLPQMLKQRSGSIINMSSCIAEIGLASRASYSASKGAVLALTKSMQVDYARYGIRVNALLPGTIYTPFVEKYLQKYDKPEEAVAQIKSRQLSNDFGKPEDVAFAALFLASDESKFMMGSPLYIDGGTTFGKNA